MSCFEVCDIVFNENSRARLFMEELLLLDYLKKKPFTQFNYLHLEVNPSP